MKEKEKNTYQNVIKYKETASKIIVQGKYNAKHFDISQNFTNFALQCEKATL